MNFKTSPPYEVNVEISVSNPINSEEWLNISNDRVNTVNEKIKSSRELHYFSGYRKMWEETELLIDLLEDGSVDKIKFGIENLSSKLEGWNYIESNSDIDYLMKEYAGFYDTILKEMSYVSGEYVSNDGMRLNPIGNKQIKLVYKRLARRN